MHKYVYCLIDTAACYCIDVTIRRNHDDTIN